MAIPGSNPKARSKAPPGWHNGYPHTDRKPVAETDTHRILMFELIDTLKRWFSGRENVYVSGNLLLFYDRGNKRRHVSPDVFVVRGVPDRQRPNYLLWEERRGPEFVIELTSTSTRREDTDRKFALYRDTLRVREYFLFDPFGDYLDPPMQGYRLRGGSYVNIRPVDERLPSLVTGLHLERDGQWLRLYDPETAALLPTPGERDRSADERVEQAEARAKEAVTTAEAERKARRKAEAEVERLRAELERRSKPGRNGRN